jgi:hypothetical protein
MDLGTSSRRRTDVMHTVKSRLPVRWLEEKNEIPTVTARAHTRPTLTRPS